MKLDKEIELVGLRALQAQARRDEVFGGMSPAERQVYDERAARIVQLENESFEFSS